MRRTRTPCAISTTETVKGMNAHRDLHTLMREIRLPEHLAPQPGRGPVHWYVRAVWESTAAGSCSSRPPSFTAYRSGRCGYDLVRLAGGTDRLVDEARAASSPSAGRA